MKISEEKKRRIFEQILIYLFQENPRSIFTAHISKEIARDEEFVKRLLLELKNKGLVIKIKKNKKGIEYLRRVRWKLSKKAYEIYKNLQE